ncbi:MULTISPECIES: DEAD/DEAH box helicase [Rhizobium/Agrobacterium group]|uniref:DEAD/DEAH box helicase n=1 Tax=Rhizobium/Agrobacterium group TaxID=227290 RepID=UPI00107F180F|nr:MULTISPECIES: helicase-related protein [Rhizobium/Agrobacterium group]MBB4404247.1 superfamily II DNA or RNA helicase [Agrobacterium radiobacter]MBB5590399.1 superfamily II DNA or RNA helicase [Agrobacterium radiobacter]TGE86674.1 helicase [Rhizobium sp. SEMIA 4032]
MAEGEFDIGDWCWHTRQATPCRVIERLALWGEATYRVWLPAKDTVMRAQGVELSVLSSVRPTVEQILHATAAAKLQDALEDNLLLAPIQSNVIPLPHQLYALNRAVGQDRIRYLLADEVGLGKTIEAGLVLRELKLRGRAKRILVVAPKGLVRQWQAEMRQHFGESFHFVDPSSLAALQQWRGVSDEDNAWRMHDQVICALDSVKPMESRRGWSLDQIQAYNRERFEDLVSAAWDLVIIDEAHRMGGSTEQVARYKLGAALADASPYLLLLSATPHQGKTDQFMRLMQLLDRDAFPDEGSVSRERVQPFVIRTEKRAAINAEGRPLFRPRLTRLHPVAWQARHAAQQQLYEAVTDYVRHGYNQALAAKQRHVGFLMILMQRLVTSSTAAIRATLEKRQAALDTSQAQPRLFDTLSAEEWADLDGEAQVDLALQANGLELEKSEVETLLALARSTEVAGTDAKAESLLELIYKLQQEEGDPALKILVFTEFVPTQAMLADYMESRGFTVATLNGGMDMEGRTRTLQTFARDARVLISTDAGGEGLNLQFCHVIVNFDMPWNPMRIEQRIGRVDRIGQKHVVRALNFVLEDTVEYRVRQVLEEKLAIIADEFGVDKAADVMDSAEVEPVFDELFVQSLQHPESIERECESMISQLRTTLEESNRNSDLLTVPHDLDAEQARKWRDHPAQFWLERAVVNGLPLRGGSATQDGNLWHVRWVDGAETPQACFDARTAGENPAAEWLTMEDTRARAIISDIPRFVAGQPLPVIRVTGLPDSFSGIWSLWEIGLAASGANRKRFLPVFINDECRPFVPAAKRVWDLLVTETVSVSSVAHPADSARWFEASFSEAGTQGESLFTALTEEHLSRIREERDLATYAFEARNQAIGRIGLPAVRQFRRRRLQTEHEARMAALDEMKSSVPELNAVTMVRIDAIAGKTSERAA